MVDADLTNKFLMRSAVDDGWPEELPELAAETPALPDFPLDSLPSVLRDMARRGCRNHTDKPRNGRDNGPCLFGCRRRREV